MAEDDTRTEPDGNDADQRPAEAEATSSPQPAIPSAAATAEALSVNLAQMQFLEDAWNTLRQIAPKKPDGLR